jgi:hypothetical protein
MAFALLFSLPTEAQLNGTGYYRIRNAEKTNEYISVANNLFSYAKCLGTAGGGGSHILSSDEAQACAMGCAGKYLQTDIHMVEDPDIINPATIIYVKKKTTNSSNYDYDLMGQSTSMATLTTGTYNSSVGDIDFGPYYINIKPSSGSGANTVYTASIEISKKVSLLFFSYNINMGLRYFMDDNSTFAISENSTANNTKWYIEPVTSFNVNPTVEFLGKYYCTMYTAFAYKLDGKVLHAYAITGINSDGTLIKEPIEDKDGIVPAGTPVVLECASNVPSENRLIPTGKPLTDTNSDYKGTNLLKGAYFCNTDGNLTFTTHTANGYGTSYFNANNSTAYDQASMRVLGIGSETGRLGFFKCANENKKMKANKVWLDISGVTFDNANASFAIDFSEEDNNETDN